MHAAGYRWVAHSPGNKKVKEWLTSKASGREFSATLLTLRTSILQGVRRTDFKEVGPVDILVTTQVSL
jgi:hypothetical protein